MGYFTDLAELADHYDELAMQIALSHVCKNADGSVSLKIPIRYVVSPEEGLNGTR